VLHRNEDDPRGARAASHPEVRGDALSADGIHRERRCAYAPSGSGGTTMGARTGAEYLQGLRERPREVWIHGERVIGDITEHPAFKNVTRSLAALYDMQHDPELREEMTYVSPTTGERVGMSFLQPRSREDLARRRIMMKRWADYSGGMMGRSPDYLNAGLMAMAAAAEYF